MRKRLLSLRLVFFSLCSLLLLALSHLSAFGAATLTQTIDPPEANVGDQVSVTLTVQDGLGTNTQLPPIPGLQIAGSSSTTNITFTNGALSSAVSQTFILVPLRPGDFTIPAFDIPTRDGQVLHAHAMRLHVLGNGTTSAPSNGPTPSANGPVIMPPTNTPQQPGLLGGSSAEDANSGVNPPVDPDGRPAKVFMVITPKTTDAYVGETIPLKIEFYIRMDVIAQQDSLPTIKGSDFLMNDLSVRPGEDELVLQNEPYHRETWITAISAPRSGDFPLEMERDTYWVKNSQNIFADPLGSFFGAHSNLAHGDVPSNQLVIHAHPVPVEGKPENFSGAIGQFQVSGTASRSSIDVGDPVYLEFSVSGEGNFDQVNCPTLSLDPAWKSYVASSKIQYGDQSHTQGEKTFRQAIIPLRPGNLKLPPANFSYFDPTVKKYITRSVQLPIMTVTGTALTTSPPPAQASAASGTSVVTPDLKTPDLAPNRLEFGVLRSSLAPAYRQPWFWASQVILLSVLFLTDLALFVLRRPRDRTRAEYRLRRRSLQELEEAMSTAVQRQDVPGFFQAARQAVQVRWATAWNLRPESITLAAIEARDPRLAEAVAPLFAQADETMYSGRQTGSINLAAWERQVREELLQPQPA